MMRKYDGSAITMKLMERKDSLLQYSSSFPIDFFTVSMATPMVSEKFKASFAPLKEIHNRKRP